MRVLAILLILLLPSVAHADRARQMAMRLAMQTTPAPSDGAHVTPLPAPEIARPAEVPITRLVPRQRYTTRTVTKYRDVPQKYCYYIGRKKYCGVKMVPESYTVTEQVPVETMLSIVPNETVPSIVSTAADDATPLDSAKRMLEFMWSSEPKTLLDLGSGNGLIVVNWALYTGYPAIGIEMDPARVAQARAFAEQKGVSHLVKILESDFTKMDNLPKADIAFAYQFDDVLAAMRDKMMQYDLVVTFAHQVPGLSMTSHNGGEFYTWRKPVAVQQVSRSVPAVRYGNRMYTRRVCNNPWCTMCNKIQWRLEAQGVY